MEFSVDGGPILLAAFGGKADLAALFEKPTDTGDAVEARLRVRAPIKAGPHIVAVTFIQGPALTDTRAAPGVLRSSPPTTLNGRGGRRRESP